MNSVGVIAVLDAVPAPLFWIENGTIGCNRAMERLTGYDRAELSSVDLFTRPFGSTAEKLRSLLEDPPSILRTPLDLELRCQDGTLKTVEISGSDSGPAIWTVQDVTALRTLQKEPSAVFKRFMMMAETTTDAFLLADRSGRIVDANERCLQLYGYRKEEFLSMSVGDLESPETREQSAAELQNVMRQGHLRFPSRHVTKDGRVIDTGLSVMLLPGEPYFIMFLRDISDRMLAERKVAESEALLKAVFDSLPFDFFALDRDGRYTMLSSGAIAKWGDPTGQTVAEYTAGKPFSRYAARWQENNRRALAGETVDQETVYSWEGEERVIHEILGPIRDSQQRILGTFGVNLDVTEQKQTQKALVQSEVRYRRFSELTSDYAYCFSRSGSGTFHFRWLGGDFEQITGYTLEEIFQQGCRFGMIHEGDRQRVVSRVLELKPGETYTDEYRIVCKNGELRWIRGSYYCEAGGSSDERLYYGASRNITARKEAEEALCRLNDALDRRVAERTAQLEAAMREQEAFSYSVSHDLRAPLRHINSFSAILLEDYADLLPPEGSDYLLRICKATRRMGVLIDNLLELSRVSRVVVNRSPVDLSALAAKIVLMFREIEPERQVEVDIAPDLSAHCDKSLVRQVLENLVGNAWKYTSNEEVARIEVGQRTSEQGPIYFVVDNGVGFEMEYREKLFAPFQRLHGAEFEGNGIGLATAQRIVERHGGAIWAEGKVGEGARFYFTLPG
ncbi:PAS domain S-box protein [Geomonas sp.]|uniref:PAS domain-containing sensor histidine kinase n=1 Tax=Geomonas sp. TaxID=2651584 RepID=UPI002B469D11|nr:PAS domain S-box protein [Geomonas sp.]HJV34811.1 PAS domain S-box protein [Geomonas sp.]